MTEVLRQLHQEVTEELRELASLYALDAMPPDEKATYEAHLGNGCAVCVNEVAAFRRVTGTIGFSVAPVSPPAQLRERLMSAVRKTPIRKAPGVIYDQEGVFIARPTEMDWSPGGLPGVFQKVLFYDKSRGFHTSMVRMTAGTHYPSHKHAGVEELYLLEGDLRVGEMAMRAGDYCRSEAGSIHEEIITRTGCLFVVTASHSDQLLR